MIVFTKPKLLQKSIIFLKYVNHVFFKHKIMLSKLSLNIFNKTIFLNIHVYFLSTLKKAKKNYNFRKISSKINVFFNNKFRIFNISTIVFKVISLNKLIKKKQVKEIFYKFLKFEKIVFLKKIDIFLNFINISYLILRKNINIKCYLILLAKIFVQLTKKEHSKFLLFIKFLTNFCINLKNLISKVTGIKFSISGRLKGKPRGSSFKILGGSVPSQHIISNVKFNQIHAYNRYGAFGLKLWINY